MSDQLPKNHTRIHDRFPEVAKAIDELGKTVHSEGPIDDKTAQLIQLAAAVGIHSQGAVTSHTRRALACGASIDEIHHSILLLTSTVGFPTMSAALSWVDEALED